MQKWIIISVIFVIVILTGVIFFNVTIEKEYIPEEEISSLELRKTMINLYFKDKQTNQIEAETKLIDSKELLGEPYKVITQYLISGPENENLERIIPENTKIIEIKLEKDILKIKFSNEVLNNNEIDSNIVESVTKTLVQFNEVRSVVIEVEESQNINRENKEEITNNINNEIITKIPTNSILNNTIL